MKRIIGQSKWSNAAELVSLIRSEGRELCDRLSSEAVVGNLIRRVLKLIRDEYHAALRGSNNDDDATDSLHKMLVSASGSGTSDLRRQVLFYVLLLYVDPVET